MLITQGLGAVGDGSGSGMLVTAGLGTAGAPDNPACLALQVLAVQSFGSYLVLTFSAELVVSGPGLLPTNYVFTGPFPLSATDISIMTPGHLLRVGTTAQEQDGAYTLTLPTQGIMDTTGNLINGPFTLDFTGVGIATTVQMARSIDERTLDIIFNKSVFPADALNPVNYSVSGGITISSAVRVTDFYYRLTTSPQTINQSYMVTVSNIRDINGIL